VAHHKIHLLRVSLVLMVLAAVAGLLILGVVVALVVVLAF
jgi:hypothetical protein